MFKTSTRTVVAVIGLSIAASACGLATETASTGRPIPSDSTQSTAPPSLDEPTTTVEDPSDEPMVNPAPGEPAGEPTTEPSPVEPAEETPSTPIEQPTPVELPAQQVAVSSPSLDLARACFADNTEELVYTPSGVNELAVFNRIGGLDTSRLRGARLAHTRDGQAVPLFEDTVLPIDEQGFGTLLVMHGRISDIQVDWVHEARDEGTHESPIFRSTSNESCWLRVGYTARVADLTPDPAPPTNPGPLPTGDVFGVAVESLELVSNPACYEGDLPERFFDTPTSPVTVLIDTKGATAEPASTTVEHERTRLDHSRLAVDLITAPVIATTDRESGYEAFIQINGFVSGAIVIKHQQSASEPGTYFSPAFNGSDPNCTIRFRFVVTEG